MNEPQLSLIPWYRTRKFWGGILGIQFIVAIALSIFTGFQPLLLLGILGSVLPSMFMAGYINFYTASILGTVLIWILTYLLVKTRLPFWIIAIIFCIYYILNIYVSFSLTLL